MPNANDRACSVTREIDIAVEFRGDSISQCHQRRSQDLSSRARARARGGHAGARGM